MATDIREPASLELDLIDPGVSSKVSELIDIAKSIFECEPIVSVETDHEIPDDHYLRFWVTVSGTIPEISKKHNEWYLKTGALLGDLVLQVHLFVSFA